MHHFRLAARRHVVLSFAERLCTRIAELGSVSMHAPSTPRFGDIGSLALVHELWVSTLICSSRNRILSRAYNDEFFSASRHGIRPSEGTMLAAPQACSSGMVDHKERRLSSVGRTPEKE
jgi:hypothetical protein